MPTSSTADLKDTQRKSRKGELTAERILDAAEELFSERGYAGTSLREVAAAVRWILSGDAGQRALMTWAQLICSATAALLARLNPIATRVVNAMFNATTYFCMNSL